MNLGGEPERDDFGLPPVDIEVPDDARELDRDVQAYRREQRALRRQQRRLRLHGPLTRDGVVLPLLASCLVLALIAGTLLTVFTAGPGTDGLSGATGPGAGASRSAHPSASAADSPTATPGGKLPDGVIQVGDARLKLPQLTAVVLALIPAGCAAGGCATAVRRLVGQAAAAGVPIYLVSGAGQLVTVRRLAAQVPQRPAVADDVSGILYRTFPPTGLTALLVKHGGVDVLRSLSSDFILTSQLRALSGQATGARATAPVASSPVVTVPAQ